MFVTVLCSSLTYNAKEIRMLLKEEYAGEVANYTVEWVVIDPASFTGRCSFLHSSVMFTLYFSLSEMPMPYCAVTRSRPNIYFWLIWKSVRAAACPQRTTPSPTVLVRI